MGLSTFQSAQTEKRIKDFAENNKLSLREAVETLCRLGLATRETPRGELPPRLLEELFHEGLAPLSSLTEGRQLQLWPSEPCTQLYLWPGFVNDSGPGYAERRRFGRVPVRLPSEGQHSDDTSTWVAFQADIIDASMKGVRLLLPQQISISVGNMVRLVVDELGVAARGLVQNMKPGRRNDQLWEVGVGFTDMSRRHWNNWMDMLTQAAVVC